MRYEVGCTITHDTTRVSCDVKIGYTKDDKDPYDYTWRKVRGYLDLRCEAGNWMYFISQQNGLVLVETSADQDKYFRNPANWLVHLYGVPEGFIENLRCGEAYIGEGILMFTKEKIQYRIWFVGLVQ